MAQLNIAGWSSSVARRAHNPKVVGSNPAPATKFSHDGCQSTCDSDVRCAFTSIRSINK